MVFEEIQESEGEQIDPAETRDTYRGLSEGDKIEVYAWGGGDERVKATGTVTDARFTTDENNDYVAVQSEEAYFKLILPWRPAEKNVGIPKPYPEPPVLLKYNDDSYDVEGILVKEA